jgi:hypothetical protein
VSRECACSRLAGDNGAGSFYLNRRWRVPMPSELLADRRGTRARTATTRNNRRPSASAIYCRTKPRYCSRTATCLCLSMSGVRSTVIDTPLALCDAASFADENLFMTDLVYKERLGEIAWVRYEPRASLSVLFPLEVRRGDADKMSRCGARRAAWLSLHSALRDPDALAAATPRQSIEVRIIAVFKNCLPAHVPRHR